MRIRYSAFLILAAVGVLTSAIEAARAGAAAGPREVIMVSGFYPPS